MLFYLTFLSAMKVVLVQMNLNASELSVADNSTLLFDCLYMYNCHWFCFPHNNIHHHPNNHYHRLCLPCQKHYVTIRGWTRNEKWPWIFQDRLDNHKKPSNPNPQPLKATLQSISTIYITTNIIALLFTGDCPRLTFEMAGMTDLHIYCLHF